MNFKHKTFLEYNDEQQSIMINKALYIKANICASVFGPES